LIDEEAGWGLEEGKWGGGDEIFDTVSHTRTTRIVLFTERVIKYYYLF
jgi:hypothetical protein